MGSIFSLTKNDVNIIVGIYTNKLSRLNINYDP